MTLRDSINALSLIYGCDNAYGEWNGTRYLNWAKTKGQYVYEVVYRLFESVNVEQRCYRSVHSILKLADTYTNRKRYIISTCK